MKVVLYMATTINGLIAKENNDTSFVSDADWKSFLKTANQIGNMIIGRKTYEVMQKGSEFSGLEKVKIVVMTHDVSFKSDTPNILTAQSPQAALKLLQEQGFNTALVAGGGTLNSTFMKEGLIDKIYLDIEPIVFGKGIRLFSDEDFEADLELIGTKKISPNEIQLHYKVKKS